MNKLYILQERVSVSKLQAPAPSSDTLHEVFKAAVRAADHGMMQPRRFLVISGEGLGQLSRVFVEAASKTNAAISPTVLEKVRNMPNRAPMIIVAIAKCRKDTKVPREEQVIACGASIQNILNAVFALGYGAIWRTGEMARDPHVKHELGLVADEEIVGFVYLGTPIQEFASPPKVDVERSYKVWPEK